MSRMSHMETQPLTSQHLQSSSFGKVDKPCFIDAYIQAQRVHAGAYAVQGRVLSSLWDCAPNKDQPDVPKQPQDCGFETPELRPRTIRPQNDLADQIQTGISISEKHEERRRPPEQPTTMAPRHTHKKATTRDGHLAHATDTTRKIVSTVDVQGKRSSGKHPIIIDSDEEHAARLTVRRERKRAKRAIVNSLHEDNCEGRGKAHDRTRGKKKMQEKPKIPAAFSLMHGFSATNIGKNRLTLATSGVFSKGKASAKTQVVEGKSLAKKGYHNIRFSEFTFLNNTRANTSRRICPSLQVCSASSVSDNDCLSATSTTQAKQNIDRILPNTIKSSKTAESVVGRCSLRENQHQQPKATVESEVWDIEIENSSLVSKLASARTDKVEEGTVVINTQGFQYPRAKVVANTRENVDTPRPTIPIPSAGEEKSEAFMEKCATPGDIHANSSPSLGPSQSASQNGRRDRRGVDIPLVTDPFSTYFPQPPVEPIDPLAYKLSSAVASPQDLTPEAGLIQEHLDTFEGEVDRPEGRPLEPVPPKSSSTGDTNKLQTDSPLVVPFANVEHLPYANSSPNSLQRAIEEYEAENHIFREILIRQPFHILDQHACLDNDYEAASSAICQTDFGPKPDLGICGDWYHDAADYQEFCGYNSRETPHRHSGNGTGVYVDTDVFPGEGPLQENMNDCPTAWESQAEAQDYDEVRCLDDRVEFTDYEIEEGQFQDEDIPHSPCFNHELCNNAESTGSLISNLGQVENRPGTESSHISSRIDGAFDETDGDNSSVLQLFSQGRVILGLSECYEVPYLTPSHFTTVLRVEADVATTLRGHWLPQKL